MVNCFFSKPILCLAIVAAIGCRARQDRESAAFSNMDSGEIPTTSQDIDLISKGQFNKNALPLYVLKMKYDDYDNSEDLGIRWKAAIKMMIA